MATNFPIGVDNFPTHTDNNNEKIAAAHLNNVQDGLKATQQKVLDIGNSNIVLTATGTADAIIITTGGSFALTQGNKLSFKAIANNTTNVTINVDGTGVKPLLKLDGSQISASGLKNGKVYDVYYDTTSGGRFFLLARATGDAVAANVLAGKGFSNETDSGLIGTMVDRGAVIITPSTVNQTITQGYHNGNGIVQGDADLIASNIRDGINIFGVLGNVIEGKRWATGTFTVAGSGSGQVNAVNITGLSFIPKTIIVSSMVDPSSQPAVYIRTKVQNYNGDSYYLKVDNWATTPIKSSAEPTTNSFTLYNVSSSSNTDYMRWVAIE